MAVDGMHTQYCVCHRERRIIAHIPLTSAALLQAAKDVESLIILTFDGLMCKSSLRVTALHWKPHYHHREGPMLSDDR